MNFKHLPVVAALVLAVTACTATRLSPAEKQAKADMIASMIADSIANRTFTVEVNYVSPQRMDARFLNSTYRVRILGDSIMSNLPYYGVAYRASFEREGPLDFDGNISRYSVAHPKKDVTQVKFFTRNKLEYIEYIFNFYIDGKCSINIISADRDKINFEGECLLNIDNNVETR